MKLLRAVFGNCFRTRLTAVLMMDNDMWLVETEDAGPKRLCSPGATSSGYCSSDEMLVSGSIHSTVKRKSNTSEQQLVDLPLSSPGNHVITGEGDASRVAKTNATFDGFADSLWEPLSTSSVDDSHCSSTTSVPQRRVYHSLITKQLAPSKKSTAVDDDAETEYKIGQTISVLNRHVASELGNPFAQTVDDCKTTYKGSGVHSTGMSVDVTVSTKGQSSSSRPPTVIIRPVGRARVAAPLVSCGSVLRRSATVPSKMPLVAGQCVVSQSNTSRSDHLYSHQAHVFHADSTPSIHEALRDHMYALKVPPPTPVHSSCVDLSKASRTKKSYSHPQTVAGHVRMSILEAFLRSTTPCFDANRGSTAIAADEMRQLNVSGSSSPQSFKVWTGTDRGDVTQAESPTPSLLKQLLTNNGGSLDVDQTEDGDREEHSPGMAVDSLLTDGFGLDADLHLDDPLSNGIGLLEDDTDTDGKVASDTSTLVTVVSLLQTYVYLHLPQVGGVVL